MFAAFFTNVSCLPWVEASSIAEPDIPVLVWRTVEYWGCTRSSLLPCVVCGGCCLYFLCLLELPKVCSIVFGIAFVFVVSGFSFSIYTAMFVFSELLCLKILRLNQLLYPLLLRVLARSHMILLLLLLLLWSSMGPITWLDLNLPDDLSSAVQVGVYYWGHPCSNFFKSSVFYVGGWRCSCCFLASSVYATYDR